MLASAFLYLANHHPNGFCKTKHRGFYCHEHCVEFELGSDEDDVGQDDEHDIKELAQPVLAHRIILRHEERAKGAVAADIVEEILSRIPVPSPV